MNDWDEKFQILKWGIDVAANCCSESNRIFALQQIKTLIDEVIAESEKIREEQRSAGLIP